MERNENGFSGSRSVRDSAERNRGCPGTGTPWRENMGGNMMGGQTGSGANGARCPVRENGTRCGESENGGAQFGQLAMVYAPYQNWRMLYSPEAALMRGTLFEELDKPLEDCVNG